ncbi:MAG: hypothetical protein M3211_06480 [Actinomycetota bacterium]|nr:hypothetical protein [Actinomycetota bacterium]
MSKTPTARPGVAVAQHRLLLLGVLAVQLVGDTALAPYFPQLFRRLFDLEELAATGTYLWVCRVTGLLALPLWAMAARRVSPQRLIVWGLWLSAALDLLLGLAPTWTAFTVLSAAHVAASASLALAYPVLVAACGGQGMSGVRSYVALFHLTMLGSAAIGALVVAMPEPRLGISAFAVVDATLALAAGRLWRGPARFAAPEPGGGARGPWRTVWQGVLLVGLLAGAVELGAGVVRPFFTEYALHEGLSLSAAAAVFAVPSVAALLVLPAASALHRRLGRRLLVVGAVVAAAGLTVQVVASDLVVLALGRAVFGAGLGMGQVALDLAVFAAVGTAGPGFIAVEWSRTAALVLIPVLATGAASLSLAAPLAVGAAAFALTAVLAALGLRPAGQQRPTEQPSNPEVDLAPDPIR